jgi:hypothetical protein
MSEKLKTIPEHWSEHLELEQRMGELSDRADLRSKIAAEKPPKPE